MMKLFFDKAQEHKHAWQIEQMIEDDKLTGLDFSINKKEYLILFCLLN